MLERAGRSDLMGSGGELPYVGRDLANAFMGSGGIFDNYQMASLGLLEVLTVGYKTAKTSLNPATHMQNVLGNIAFLTQAGFNILDPANYRLMEDMTKAFGEIKKAHVTARKLVGPRGAREQFLAEVNAALAGKTIKYKGKNVNLVEFSNPLVHQIYEEGAFDAVEGFSMLTNIMPRLGESPAKSIAKMMLKARDNRFTQIGVKVGTAKEKSLRKLFDGMVSTYLAEDIVPKMALYVHQRAGGMSMSASTRWVARKMPMYGTVGNWIKKGRRMWFPWATFPSEALRITKNNLIDNPLVMLPWMQASDIAQGVFSMLGMSEPSREAAMLAKTGAALWAQREESIVGRGEMVGAGGGFVGTFAGAAFGGALGGVRGAAVGAAGGATIGVTGGLFGQKNIMPWQHDTQEHQDRIRVAVLNWLPHTSFLPQIRSPQIIDEETGMTLSEGFNPKKIPEMMEYLPAEPLAIFRPLMDIAYGRGGFGQEIKTTGAADAITKTMAGYIGFISPPWFQKYGFKTTTPDVAVTELLGLGDYAEYDPTNVAKFLVDVGADRDAISGEPGNPVLDIALNNIGMWKTYPVFAETSYANSLLEERHFQEARNKYSRNLRFHLYNLNEDSINDILRRVYNTFIHQHKGDMATVQDEFDEWITRYIREFGRHPKLRHLSKDELEQKRRDASEYAKRAATAFSKEMADVLIKERKVRALSRLGGNLPGGIGGGSMPGGIMGGGLPGGQ